MRKRMNMCMCMCMCEEPRCGVCLVEQDAELSRWAELQHVAVDNRQRPRQQCRHERARSSERPYRGVPLLSSNLPLSGTSGIVKPTRFRLASISRGSTATTPKATLSFLVVVLIAVVSGSGVLEDRLLLRRHRKTGMPAAKKTTTAPTRGMATPEDPFDAVLKEDSSAAGRLSASCTVGTGASSGEAAVAVPGAVAGALRLDASLLDGRAAAGLPLSSRLTGSAHEAGHQSGGFAVQDCVALSNAHGWITPSCVIWYHLWHCASFSFSLPPLRLVHRFTFHDPIHWHLGTL